MNWPLIENMPLEWKPAIIRLNRGMASRWQVRSVTTAANWFGNIRTVPQSFKYKTFPLKNVQFSEKYLHRIFLLSYVITKHFPTFQVIISEKLLSSIYVNMVVWIPKGLGTVHIHQWDTNLPGHEMFCDILISQWYNVLPWWNKRKTHFGGHLGPTVTSLPTPAIFQYPWHLLCPALTSHPHNCSCTNIAWDFDIQRTMHRDIFL
jgi:hypothetical protein